MVRFDNYNPRDISTGYPWIKVRTNLQDDPVFARLSDVAKVVYFEAYLLAGKSDAGGLILAGDKPATLEDLAWLLRRSKDELQRALDKLQTAGLIELQDNQVTVSRFASEQGPSRKEERKEWAYRSAKKRALARGEVWQDESKQDTDTDAEQKADVDLKTKTEQDQDLNTKNKTKTKSVTRPSRVSHESVTRDIICSSECEQFGLSFLDDWEQQTGLQFNHNQKFFDMVQRLIDQGVTLDHVHTAIAESRGKADTPFYLEVIAINAKNTDPKVIGQRKADKYRDLYREVSQKRKQDQAESGGDNGI